VSLFSETNIPLRQFSSERWLNEYAVKNSTLTRRLMSVVTRVSPFSGVFEIVCVPILLPL
jgi:hypothetical protein